MSQHFFRTFIHSVVIALCAYFFAVFLRFGIFLAIIPLVIGILLLLYGLRHPIYRYYRLASNLLAVVIVGKPVSASLLLSLQALVRGGVMEQSTADSIISIFRSGVEHPFALYCLIAAFTVADLTLAYFAVRPSIDLNKAVRVGLAESYTYVRIGENHTRTFNTHVQIQNTLKDEVQVTEMRLYLGWWLNGVTEVVEIKSGEITRNRVSVDAPAVLAPGETKNYRLSVRSSSRISRWLANGSVISRAILWLSEGSILIRSSATLGKTGTIPVSVELHQSTDEDSRSS